MIKARKATLYSLFCDNCGRQFEGNDYDEFFDVDDMLDEAADDADWVGLYDGKKEPKEEFDHLSYAEQHFCCEECREKWLKRRRFKSGDLVRMGKREFVLEGDEEEDGTVILVADGDDYLTSRHNEVQLLMTVDQVKELRQILEIYETK